MPLAPIVLFVYNRPTHTRRTLEALKQNDLAKESELFVFADGPKKTATEQDLKNIAATRAVVREQNWCGKVNVIERESNQGLAANITSGVSTIVNKYGRVIVLEDDIVTAPSFLTYMNRSLDLYEQDPKVMHIAGYSFPWLDRSGINSQTFFYRVPSCWGWATWARSWKYYNDDSRQLFVSLCENHSMSYFDFGYSGAFLGQLNANILGTTRTWAVKWYASVALQKGLALHPSLSLVNNSGFDNTGENAASTNIFNNDVLGTISTVDRQEIEENNYVSKKMYSAYGASLAHRVRVFIANRIKNFVRLKYFVKG